MFTSRAKPGWLSEMRSARPDCRAAPSATARVCASMNMSCESPISQFSASRLMVIRHSRLDGSEKLETEIHRSGFIDLNPPGMTVEVDDLLGPRLNPEG